MMKKKLENKIINKLAKILNVKKEILIKKDDFSLLESWDSLKHLEIITEVDEILDNRLSKIKNAEQLTSLKKILNLIKK
jgi:acyl carrier protein|tara:strand:+ start:937 stop:1173 length:237 start_codon:yes stop_codon:yes gene_type:complete